MKLSEVKWPLNENRSIVTKINGDMICVKYNVYWSSWFDGKDFALLEMTPDKSKEQPEFLGKVLEALRVHENRWFGDV